jgi:hypothetical protein
MATSRISAAPSLSVAIGGAALLLVVLVTGQIVFPAKTHTLQSGTLDQPIALVGSNRANSNDDAQSTNAGSYVAMRIPSDSASAQPDTPTRNEDSQSGNGQSALPWESTDTEVSAATDAATSGEAASTSPATPPRERIVEFLNGSLRLDVYKHARVGSPEATHILVEMISYDCPHCRKMHRIMKEGLSRYGEQIAIVVMPIPLEMSCNKLVTTSAASHPGACTTARMALGVAALRPDLFPAFHDWLMADKEKPPLQSQVVTKAYNTVDSTQLSKYSRSAAVKEQIASYIDLYSQIQRRQSDKKLGLPVQILGDHILSGMVAKENDVFEAWEKHLGVERR